jgi:N-methylhydantoinase B
MTTVSQNALNPITYEIVRNRLIAVSEEMRIAMQSVSGSPTVTEASDFFTGLFLPDGTFATMGFQVTMEAPPVSDMIKHLLTKGTVSINPGDMFIGNDPYIGALHQNDVQMTGPIFYKGDFIAWASVMAHETDVGGMDFASWSPAAREIFQEGMRIPAVKIVDGGEVREDVLEFILAASRLPGALGLDIRAFIATINVASDRLTDLIDRYGIETVKATMKRMIDVSEIRTRERLRELPDGEIHATDFLEHDGHQNRLYKIDLRMTKKGDALRLDFSGSSPQAPGFINATRSGLRGGVAGALIPTLGFDIPWNEGMMRPVEIVAPDGLICTAQHPAPVGSATVEAVWVITNVVSLALNKLLACSPRYMHRTQAVSNGTMATFNMGGMNQFGERFGMHLLDPQAGGFGAYGFKDGIDAGGPLCVPMPRIADVEGNEQVFPLLYLYRRLGRDTGGSGRYRGGRGAEMAVTLGGIDEAEILIMTHGLEVPNSVGLFGGWPGATVRQRFGSRALNEGRYPSSQLAEDPEQIGGAWQELGPKPGLMPMTKEDVFAVLWQGGGGWGDPLDRDPEAVWSDLQSRVISPNVARSVYGVICTEQGVDLEGTNALQRQIRQERIGKMPVDNENEQDASTRIALGPSLRLIKTEQGWQMRTYAGYVLAQGTTAWRAGAIARPLKIEDYPGQIRLHEDLAMTAFYCPASGTLLAVDVHEKGVDPSNDVLLDLKSLELLQIEAELNVVVPDSGVVTPTS